MPTHCLRLHSGWHVPHRGYERFLVGSAVTEILGVADPTRSSVTGHLASLASFSNPTCHNPMSSSFICG